MLEGPGVVPGLGPFLRTATVTEGPEGTVRVVLPPGPARERLADPTVRRALGATLSSASGRRLEVTLPDDENPAPPLPEPPRVTHETVREGRLEELLDREPLLE